MSTNNVQILISQEQPLEILIEFPIHILCSYNGGSELDLTWYDNIMYLIHKSLLDGDVIIESVKLDILPEARSYKEKLCYHMFLKIKPPILDLNFIVEALTVDNFHKELCIKKKVGASKF